MKTDKLILAILAAAVLIKFFTGFPLDNQTIPGGTDVAHFLTNTWYISTYGMTKWNYFWYGGFPFMRYYPPLAFLITSFIGKAMGFLVAYKFVNNLFLALDVLAFYFFVREFKLSKEKEIVSTIIFSFIPIFGYFFVDGRFPTLINVFFALLYWKFLKRSLDNKKLTDITIAALFIGISLLTHHTTTFLFILVSSVWALIYKPSFGTIKKLIAIGILTIGITAWWSIPFFLETLTTSTGGLYLRSVGNVYVGDIMYRIRTSVLQSPFYTSNAEPYLLAVLAVFISAMALLSLKKYRDKTTRDFIILSIFIIAMLLVVRYERSVIFLAVPISIIVAEGFDTIKRKLRLVAEIAFIALVIASYFLIRPQMYEIPNYPNIPKDGRVIFFPIGSAYVTNSMEMKNFYDVIFSPMSGQENIRGWHDESQLVGKDAAYKWGYILNVSDPQDIGKTEYYNLLSEGYINYVVVNKNATSFLNYFNDSMFKEIYSDSMFSAYQINPKSTYVEINGGPVQSNVTKSKDTIDINTTCQKGTLVVKESYHQMWNAEINGKKAAVSFNDYGFIKLDSNIDGNCRIALKFEDPSYYSIFYVISIAAMIFILISLIA